MGWNLRVTERYSQAILSWSNAIDHSLKLDFDRLLLTVEEEDLSLLAKAVPVNPFFTTSVDNPLGSTKEDGNGVLSTALNSI
jgi:hypothetical protein